MSGARVYCKPEFFGPTSSYKDRIAPVLVNNALRDGFKKIAVVSSGNFGLAVAHASKKAGLECTVLCLSSVLSVYKDAIAFEGAEISFFGDSEAAFKELEQRVNSGYFSASAKFSERAFKDPPGIEDYGTISTEIIEQLGKAPDFVITPSAYGDGATGMLNAFIKMKNERIIERVPRFVLTRAHESEDDIVYSITTNRTTPQVEFVLRESNGMSLYFSESDYLEGQKILKKECDLAAEVSSGGIVSALRKLTEEKTLSEKSAVVTILTAGQR